MWRTLKIPGNHPNTKSGEGWNQAVCILKAPLVILVSDRLTNYWTKWPMNTGFPGFPECKVWSLWVKEQVGKQDANSDSSDGQNVKSFMLSIVGEDMEERGTEISTNALQKKLTACGRVKDIHILPSSNSTSGNSPQKNTDIHTTEPGTARRCTAVLFLAAAT